MAYYPEAVYILAVATVPILTLTISNALVYQIQISQEERRRVIARPIPKGEKADEKTIQGKARQNGFLVGQHD